MKKNNKGFTLVELLAVIVIMGILMMVAIPSVTRTIENSRKDTFVDIAKSYGNAARTLWTSDNLTCNGVVSSAVDDGDYYILINSKSGAKESLPVLVDQGGKSSWGNRDVNGYVRVNVSTTPGEDANSDGIYELEPRRVTKFYVALSDGTHGLVDDNTLMMDELKRGNVVMTLSTEQLKKIEFTLDDGKLNCSRDSDGKYICTNVIPIKNMTGVCVDDNTTVATVTPEEPEINTPLYFGKHYVYEDQGIKFSYVFYEDGSVNMYEDCFSSFILPEGSIEYNGQQILYGGNNVASISVDKKKLTFNDGSGEYILIGDGTCVGVQSQYSDLPMLLPRTKIESVMFVNNISYNSIKTITLQTTINVPQGVETYDFSIGQNKKVIAYVKTNAENSNYYDLYIQGDGNLYAPEDSSQLFSYKNVTEITNLNLLNTSKVTNMEGMFRYISTTSLNLSNFDTSKVINMRGMFGETKVTSLNLSNFNTSKVTNMAEMFEHSRSLQTLNLGGFDTSNVTDMYDMFLDLENLEKLDISSFNTSKVTTMSWMFGSTGRYNPNFTLILGEGFDTSNVTDMTNMFIWTGEGSSNFNLDCSGWNVDKVIGNHYWGNDKIIEPIWKN